jgi:transposase
MPRNHQSVAALDYKAGTVIGEFHRRHQALEFRSFLETIDTVVPGKFELHLILDNYGTHKTSAIKRWLLRHPRFHLHFTPTGTSWLNLVERWFAALTEKQLRRGAHRSTRELEDAIRRYLDLSYRNPKPSPGPKPPPKSSNLSDDFVNAFQTQDTREGCLRS